VQKPDPYDSTPEFGLLYDAVPAYAARRDAEFYASLAARLDSADARILEVGCGTGRVLLPIARSGHRVVGLDASATMLEQFHRTLSHEPMDVRGRVRLQRGDMRDFSLGTERFELITAPFRIFQHLARIDDQLRALRTIRAHLAPGGRFAFDVFNPNYDALTRDRSAEAEDTPELRMADGRFLRRLARVPNVRFVEQLNDVDLIYEVRSPKGTERFVQSFQMRWYFLPELEHLLARAGFTVENVFGNFDRSPLTDTSPEIVIVARSSAGES
jgi:SAM-dependent methyltransferase